MKRKLAVVALGGNALLRGEQAGTIDEQEENTTATLENLVFLIREGYDLIITHGNGPQVGNILMRNDAGEQMYNIAQMPVDILTGFYNLRIGVYGALNPGAHLKIPTFTTAGISEIEVEVLTGPERQARPFFPAAGTLLRVKVDPEVFNTGRAALYVWFDGAGHPARGIVENVIGLGDVYGRLREEPKLP